VVEHYEALHTLAEVATAFAGFTGIVVVLGGRENNAWRTNDRTAVFVLLLSSLGVVFFGFAPDLTQAAHLEPNQAWRLSIFLFAIYHLAIILGGVRGQRHGRIAGEPEFVPWPVTPVAVTGGSLIVLGQLLIAAGFLQSWMFFFYLAGLLWMLAICTATFAMILLHSMRDGPAA
jgi:hypothetical protein